MKKFIFSFILIILMTIYASANPEIVFEKTIHNFGKVKPDTIHSAVFTFFNRGTSDLIIERVRAG